MVAPDPIDAPSLNYRGLHFPILFGLQRSVFRCGPGVSIVDERHAVAYEDVVFDQHTFADKAVARDLAVLPYLRVLLNLDERADLGLVANLAAIQVDELR